MKVLATAHSSRKQTVATDTLEWAALDGSVCLHVLPTVRLQRC